MKNKGQTYFVWKNLADLKKMQIYLKTKVIFPLIRLQIELKKFNIKK
jgi:hypothetical protein